MKPNSIDELVALRDGVPMDSEIERIYKLPRRHWTKRQLRINADRLSAELRTPGGTQTLWPEQAAALREIGWYGGVVAGLGAGEGKTLVGMLAATMLPSVERPLLITLSPSIKSGKVGKAYEAAKQHWRVREDLHWISYEELQSLSFAEYLLTYRPGMLILDEAHRCGRRDSARSARVEKWRSAVGGPVVVLSGTLMSSRVVEDVNRLCEWARGDESPLPLTAAKQTVRRYKLAMQTCKIPPGVLESHEAVGKRYRETPGVVISRGKASVEASLYTHEQRVDLATPIIEAFSNLRSGKLPDGTEVIDTDGHKTWQVAATLALGYWRRWNPHPPLEWLVAYRNWAAFCREYIADQDNECDTELRVRLAHIDDPDCWPLHEWRAIKPTYTEPKETVWISDTRVKAAAAWLREHSHGLLWTQHPVFGRAVSIAANGCSFYHASARDQNGRSIIEHPTGSAAIASTAACSTDLDGLQHRWYECLYVTPPASGEAHEQSLARLHRHGQQQPEVHATYWIACTENKAALEAAFEKETLVSLVEGRPRRLLTATHSEVSANGDLPQWCGKPRKSIMI